MRHFTLMSMAAIAALLASGGCGSQGAEQTSAAADKSRTAAPEYPSTTKSPPPKAPSADALAPTGERGTNEGDKDKDKEKRANTPPGMDRSGGGPASGAIVDPAGVTWK